MFSYLLTPVWLLTDMDQQLILALNHLSYMLLCFGGKKISSFPKSEFALEPQHRFILMPSRDAPPVKCISTKLLRRTEDAQWNRWRALPCFSPLRPRPSPRPRARGSGSRRHSGERVIIFTCTTSCWVLASDWSEGPQFWLQGKIPSSCALIVLLLLLLFL